MNYTDYYEFVKNRLKPNETARVLGNRLYEEVIELIDAIEKNDTEAAILELGDIVFYTVALQSKFEELVSYNELNFNDIEPNEIYLDYEDVLVTRYMMFYAGALVGFTFDSNELTVKLNATDIENEANEDLGLMDLQYEQQNIVNGLNFYSTVLIELFATIADRLNVTLTTVIERNIDKLVQRDNSK